MRCEPPSSAVEKFSVENGQVYCSITVLYSFGLCAPCHVVMTLSFYDLAPDTVEHTSKEEDAIPAEPTDRVLTDLQELFGAPRNSQALPSPSVISICTLYQLKPGQWRIMCSIGLDASEQSCACFEPTSDCCFKEIPYIVEDFHARHVTVKLSKLQESNKRGDVLMVARLSHFSDSTRDVDLQRRMMIVSYMSRDQDEGHESYTSSGTPAIYAYEAPDMAAVPASNDTIDPALLQLDVRNSERLQPGEPEPVPSTQTSQGACMEPMWSEWTLDRD